MEKKLQAQEEHDTVTRAAIDAFLNAARLEFMKPDAENKYYAEMMDLMARREGSLLKCGDRYNCTMLDFPWEFARKYKLYDWLKRNTMPIVVVRNPDSPLDGCRLTITHVCRMEDAVLTGMAPKSHGGCCTIM
jgi:hypothetical protein